MLQLSSNKLYPRKIIDKIKEFLFGEEIIVVVGARQVGKTCILQLLKEELLKNGIEEKSIYYFDLEDLSLLKVLNGGANEFLSYLSSIGVNLEGKTFIFIDEIQHLDNPSNFLKIIGDHHKNIKLIVSGSSTFEIRKKFKDSLAGRKILFEVYPLDFSEFLLFKEKKVFYNLLLENNLFKIRTEGIEPDFEKLKFHADDFKRLFEEFTIYGGYPRTVLEPGYEKKVVYLTEKYNTYVKKDIKDLMRIDNVTAFNNLLQVLSLQVGNLLNYNSITADLQTARDTIERYVFVLENTFIAHFVLPYFTNRRKEIIKMPKIYFFDNGLRNVATKNFEAPETRVDAGALVENYVFTQLIKNLKTLEELRFWRTLSKNEIDFIIMGQNPVPVEIKYRPFKSPALPKGIRYFLKKYPVQQAFVLTKDFFARVEEGKTRIYFLPVWM